MSAAEVGLAVLSGTLGVTVLAALTGIVAAERRRPRGATLAQAAPAQEFAQRAAGVRSGPAPPGSEQDTANVRELARAALSGVLIRDALANPAIARLAHDAARAIHAAHAPGASSPAPERERPH